MKQTAKITFEMEETVLLRKGSSIINEFCPRCQGDAVLMTPETISKIADVSEREIFRLMEAGEIYFIERKRIYACPECFRRFVEHMAAGGDI
ncbi:MAG TPA: hypothetical protein VHQ01_05910 [Pyrinomonadaceae bacterium]|nr:hypothetical protein [Pyrinomonadaceae bacterium]